MTLSSMTGFARASGESGGINWAWEAKSVNGRGLDIRVNAPNTFDKLPGYAKSEAAKMFRRGSIQMSLRVDAQSDQNAIVLNRSIFSSLVETVKHETGDANLSSETLATLLNVRGVVQENQINLWDLAENAAFLSDIQSGLAEVLCGLDNSRRREGKSLLSMMMAHNGEMRAILKDAEAVAGAQPNLLRARLKRQLEDLKADDVVDKDRLSAEIAMSAAKADVREELDRLKAHFETADAHLAEGSPVGRKLDFLAQELNREANTLCSKSVSLELTNAGLALKAVIDQFKEQAANVE